ncbi:MAG: carbohydrate porin, partial [Planctomycetota bacterium]
RARADEETTRGQNVQESADEAPSGILGWLSERGLDVSFGLTQIFQQNVRGGVTSNRKAARYSGSYDLELNLDMEKIAGIAGGRIYLLTEGSWSEGIDPIAVGSLFGVNADAGGNRSADVTQLFYEQAFPGAGITVRLGKLDLTGGFECRGCPVSFDGNSFANDQTAQFLNGALVNNPTIPFPDCGLGVVVHFEPVEWLYFSVGTADAEADARETGFRTAFHGKGDFFTICELGVTPRIPSPNGALQGAYRVGMWYDPRDKDRLDGLGSESDNTGFYASFDQKILRESAEEDDNQGLGAFARLGFADEDVNEIKFFWSAGVQYEGLIPGRDTDALGVGFAQGRLSDKGDFTARHESALEVYYNARLTDWLEVTPSLQLVFNPGGNEAAKRAVVVGCRVQTNF